jgi:cell division protein FtsI (penicillin-binding protein 3)
MIRTPLRPLARILSARVAGENPDDVERDNLRQRHEMMRDRARSMAEGRLVFLALAFFMVFGVIGARMGLMAATVPEEPRSATTGAEILAQRADITDRNGRILATNMATHALYAQTADMVDPPRVARELAKIFPELKADDLERRFTDGRSFLWLRKVLSPEQMQKVHEIGDPGLLFGPREMRLYPNGSLAAHVLGGTSFGAEGVSSAEVIGTAGVEKQLDQRLRDPGQAGQPLVLSLDLTVQATIEEILGAGMVMMNAKGAAAVLMDVHTGEIVSMASLPSFDPNNRPSPLIKGDPSDSPLFNRAVQGVYELGSTFKIFAASQALELGLVNINTIIDAKTPLVSGRFRIKEFKNHNYGMLPVWDVIAKSSNVGTARIALQIGGLRQQAFLKSLGFFDPTPVEIVEAAGARPLVQKRWSDIVTITTSYGHGLAASPMHLASAYAALANGGVMVKPTLLHSDRHPQGTRILSEAVAKQAVEMLRRVVTEGTASYAEVPGYDVAGKTGTADKARRDGRGYYKDKVVNTFASVFPADDPQYVLIVTLDEPVDTSGPAPRRTAGYTTVPIAAEIIRRTAPLLGLRPRVETDLPNAVAALSNRSGVATTGGN